MAAATVASHTSHHKLLTPTMVQPKPMSDPCGLPLSLVSQWRKSCHGKRLLTETEVIPVFCANDGPSLKRTRFDDVNQFRDGTSGGEADDGRDCAHTTVSDNLEDILDAETLILGQVDGCDVLNDIANLDDLLTCTTEEHSQKKTQQLQGQQ